MEGKLCADGEASPPSAPSPQVTRVESLFHLVKDGSCVDVRENAAEKLGEIALQSPVYCKSILRQIRVLLVDKEWAVRVAAAKCLDVIAHSFQNDPSLSSSVALRFARASFAGREASCPHLNCRTVNIETVIDAGAPLLRSGGEEYEYQINLSDDQRKLQAVRQRQLLLRRICGGAAAEGLWKTGEDSLAQHMLPRLNSEHVKELADDIEASEVAHNGTRSIPTEAAQRKRAAEMLPDQHRMAKKTKEEDLESERDEPEGVDLVALLVADLFESVFDSTWEVRHGSFAALRHILLSSGLTINVPHEKDVKDAMVIDLWIEESLMRCLCVLALDQFVDYSADGSVAPVRELTAQVFGILLGSLHDQELLQAYLVVLRKLLQAASWHTSHGGLLGIKYLLRAHTAHAAALVPLVVQDVVAMIEVKRRGAEEDVLLVASGILGDMAPHLDSVNPTLLRRAARSLWLIATATRTVTGSMVASATIQTLQRWYQCASIAKILRGMSDESLLWDQLARIVPLLHHHDQAVRVATAACIKALVGENDRQLEISGTARETLRYLLSHLLLQLLCDDQDDARVMVLLCWAAVVEWCAAADRLVELMEDLVPQWLEIVWGLDSVTVLNRSRETEPDDTVSSSISMPSKENLAARVAYAEAVGMLLSHIPLVSEAYEAAIKQVTQSIESLSGEQQCGSLMLLYWWAVHSKKKGETKGQNPLTILRGRVGETLEALAQRNWIPKAASSSFYYVEQAGSLQRVLRMERRLLEIFETADICIIPSKDSTDSLRSCAAVSRQVAERITQYPYSKLASSPHAFEQAHFSRQDLFLLDDVIQHASSRVYARVQGIGSCAYSNVFVLPTKKSGFLVKALMDAIKTEENSTVRGLTAETLAQFVISQVDFQCKCVSKIISNLCNSAVALAYRETDKEETSTAGGEEDRTRHLLKVRVQGAETALQAIAHASKSLNSLPILPEVVTRGYRVDGIQWTDKLMQENARLVAVLVPSLGTTSIRFAVKWLDELSQVIGETFEYECTRHAVAHAIAHICGKLSIDQLRPEAEAAMAILYQKLFSGHAQDDDQSTLSGKSRRLAAGSIMVLDRLVIEMGSQLTPYVPSLLHFAMRAMQAAESTVRTLAAKAFADLLPLMPLQMDLISSHIHNPQLQKVLHENQSSRAFFERLLQGKAIATVSVATVLSESFSLRAYQQHGVDWLAFLVENRMGGVLADDMGLGKTIQLLATIASSVSKKSKTSSLSLIVCPPIVVHHWITEAARCFPGVFADILEYSGPVAKRKAMLSRVRNANGPVLLVATYAAVRSDRDLLKALPYDFAVLDEAHLIRNPKSALFDAVCSLRAIHRFVLSGTPLQNHVGDLWALFTFLMPGYLGDYADFRRDFELPISKSRERTPTPKQKELAAHAINTLHQRVLPFILRRTKDTVLKELPPKIISNVLLPLTPLQQRLYRAATTCDSQANTPGTKDGGPLPGVLRQLQLLKKICVHPALVQDEDVMINEATASEKNSLLNWKHSGKMIGLRDLLVESCDLGRDETDSGEVLGENHRCLVFAHLTETLDVVQTMLTQALPKVTSFRLDGKTPIAKRQGIVTAFNEDPSIDLLLLTTAVGGLGLTLTGADTVIFVEHSWNPFVDLQAMDRAHRIGQKKTVRVFRLIMEASLEEHIMDLQAFKEQVAQTVVTTTEASTSMNANTKNVLHLLQTSSTAVKAQEAAVHAQAHSRKLKQGESGVGIPGVAVELLHQIGELWDQSQYDSLAFPSMP